MIVDDNAKMRGMIRSFLSKSVQQVVECADGNEVLAAYERHQPDWILMDVVMKEVDGITATKALRRSFPEAKVIILTQYDDTEVRAQAEHAGAVGFVLKENLSELLRIL